jgi:hypothetical protein
LGPALSGQDFECFLGTLDGSIFFLIHGAQKSLFKSRSRFENPARQFKIVSLADCVVPMVLPFHLFEI